MKFECKKTENCFARSQTYEYRLPVTGEVLSGLLPDDWEQRRNLRLRRPVFIADRSGVNVKGVLANDTVKVSYPDTCWEAEKRRFETWLEETDV